ncbi:MAG: sulfatase-like hydrolase/transferase [Proteobacteria bacterium]|nr:sulfatase-like hydrolase/transferase [Pseudomonadota bacterium]
MNTKRAFWIGAAAGFLTGFIDVIWSWPGLEQFLPTFMGKLACGFFVGCLYSLFGAPFALISATSIDVLVRYTHFGDILGLLGNREQRDNKLSLLSYVIAFVPLLLVALFVAYAIGYETIVIRHNKGLIIAVVMAATLGLSLAAFLTAFAIGRIVETGLSAIASGRIRRVLSHPASPIVATMVFVAVGATWVIIQAQSTLWQLGIRPYAAILGFVLLFFALWPLSGLVAKRIEKLYRKGTNILILIFLVVLFLTVLVLGSSLPVRKGSTLFSGLGGRLTEMIRRTSDLDFDGFSSIMGGGDCNSFDSSIYPGAADIPGDGIDQDCIGGDATGLSKPEDQKFVSVPNSVPKDANILFITVDTVRADHFSCYGYERETTPAIDALAKEGSLFLNMWAHAPSTRYSIPAILTGRHPSQILWDKTVWWPGLQAETYTMAEMMKDHGLTTGAILCDRYFYRKRHIDQGFDYYNNKNASLHHGKNPADTTGTSSKEQADFAVEYLINNKDNRFFLWVHFEDPHYKYEEHEGTPTFGPGEIDRYDTEILFTDKHVSRIFETLRELSIYDKTIIIVTSDHGEGFGEHGIDFHGYHLYSPQTKVPMIVRVPGLESKRISMPAGHVDLVPTMVNLVGGKPINNVFGRSLVAEMAGLAPPDSDREIFQEVIYEGPTERRAVVTKKWHLIYNMVPDNTFELYDIETDPLETRDLWGQVDVDSLKDSLLTWINTAQLAPEGYVELMKSVFDEWPPPNGESDSITDLKATFGDSIQLLGYEVEPTDVLAGQEVRLKYAFKCLKKMSSRQRLFVHLIHREKRVANYDHIPVKGAYPLDKWKPGQYIIDEHIARIPKNWPDGDVKVAIGFWNRRTKKRLTISDTDIETSHDRLELTEIHMTGSREN